MSDINFKKACLVELSNHVLDKNNSINLRMGSKDLYIYTGKFYKYLSDFQLSQLIQKFYIDNGGAYYYTPAKAENISKTIKSSPMIKEVEFDSYNNLINLENGVFDLDKYQLLPHDKNQVFTYCLDVKYDEKDRDCPNFINFLQGIFTNDDGSPDNDTIENIFRLGGYLIYPQNKIEKIFIFLGGGENGKTMLIDILSSFFPDEFISSVALSTLSNENSQERTPLLKSRLNVSSEAKGDKVDDGEIKKIASGQKISVARKFMDPVEIRSRTKLLVDSNHMLYFNDTSWGMERRLAFFDFKNTFLDKEFYNRIQNPEKKRIFLGRNKDEFMSQIMKEKSAIFNLFIDGLIELKSRNWKLPQTQNMNNIMDEYKDQTDTLGTWLVENYVVNENVEKKEDLLPVTAIVQEYAVYYSENFAGKRINCSSKLIGRRIKDKFKVDGQQIKHNNSTTTGYPLLNKVSF